MNQISRGNLSTPQHPYCHAGFLFWHSPQFNDHCFPVCYPESPLTLMHIQRMKGIPVSRQSRHHFPTSPSITNRILMPFQWLSLSYFANHHFCARPAVFLLNSIFSHSISIVCLWNFFNIFSLKFYYFGIFKPTIFKILCILYKWGQ